MDIKWRLSLHEINNYIVLSLESLVSKTINNVWSDNSNVDVCLSPLALKAKWKSIMHVILHHFLSLSFQFWFLDTACLLRLIYLWLSALYDKVQVTRQNSFRQELCTFQTKIHKALFPSLQKGLKFPGEWGFRKIVKRYMKINWNFQTHGRGSYKKIPSVGDTCIFFNVLHISPEGQSTGKTKDLKFSRVKNISQIWVQIC